MASHARFAIAPTREAAMSPKARSSGTPCTKGPSLLLQCVLFVVVAVPAFYMGMLLAALPCFDSTPGLYCSAHGGGVVFAGMGLGLLLAIVSGRACVKALRKTSSSDIPSKDRHE